MHNFWEYFKGLVDDGITRIALGSSVLLTYMGSLNWDAIFMVAGFLFGLITLLINWYYKHKNSKVYAQAAGKAAERGYVMYEPKE
jgi:hypothetical protein